MQRVSNVDLGFLLAETPNNHMHVMGTLILDAAHMPGGYRFEHLRALFAERLHLLPAFRRRLVEVPFGLAAPVWIEDPDFDLDLHLRRAAIPSPGGLRELADYVGEQASRPLERDKPLWEAHLVEGLAGGDVAVVTKLHHAVMDGGTGANLLAHLFELSPEGSPVEPPASAWIPDAPPSRLGLLAEALAAQPLRPWRTLTTLVGASASLARWLPMGLRKSGRSGPALFSAPRTSFNRALTPHRRVAFGHCELGQLKQIAKAAGCKLNDVVLAASTSSLRAYLQRRFEPTDAPLIASVPISLHAADDDPARGNRLSMMLIPLPVDMADPQERLRAIRLSCERGKQEHSRAGGDVVQPLADFLLAAATPGLLASALELTSRSRVSDRLPPLWNVVVSNMAGPRVPIYCAGARVKAIYPMGPVVDGVGLNFTVLSNAGNLDVGILACRELVDDVDGLTAGFVAGVRELARIYAVEDTQAADVGRTGASA